MGGDWDPAESADELDGVVQHRAESRSGSIAAVSGSEARERWSDEAAGLPVPEAIVDALVETVWAFPGLRVSYARVLPSRKLRFLACAGPEEISEITGRSVPLDPAPKYLAALRNSEEAFGIEDVRVDPRTRPLAPVLEAFQSRALLAMPIRRRWESKPLGVLIFDAPRPRTWSRKEQAALDRLVPLITLALDNAAMRDELEQAKSSVAEYERRLGAMRGVVSGVIHDTNILVQGLTANYVRRGGDAQASTEALGRQLEGVLSELIMLDDNTRRDVGRFDINELVTGCAPALRALVGADTRLLTQLSPEPIAILGHRMGIERTLINLVVHAANLKKQGGAMVVETASDGARVSITLRGDALGMDDALALLAQGEPGDPATPDALGIGLWLARCEVLLHGGSLRVFHDSGKTSIRIELPVAR